MLRNHYKTQALRPQHDCELATSAVCARESILKMVAVGLREQAFRSPGRAIIFFKFIGDSDLKYVARRKFARDAAKMTGGEVNKETCSLAIIGAGPQALTLVLRLIDRLTHGGLGNGDLGEAEAARRCYCLKKGGECKTKCGQIDGSTLLKETGIQIFDDCGIWLQRWYEQFETLEILHLRSPARTHPDPSNRPRL